LGLAHTYEHIDADAILFFYDSHNSIQAPLTCRLGLCCAVLLQHCSLGLVAIIFVLRILVLASLLVAVRRLLLVAIILVLRLLVLGSLLRVHVLASILLLRDGGRLGHRRLGHRRLGHRIAS